MKNEKDLKHDDLVQQIGELAKYSQKITCQAIKEYSAEVETILNLQIDDQQHIERCLDGMLDFCFDPKMLFLYKKLCRYYFNINPQATVSYVHSYHDMSDEQA